MKSLVRSLVHWLVHWLAFAVCCLTSVGCSSCDRPEPPPAEGYEDPAAAASHLLDRAERVAASAEQGDDRLSNCALAWRELAEMARADSGLPTSFPARARFEAQCEQLPTAAQRCLRVSVSLRDPEGCERSNRALSPDQVVILHGIMTGGEPGSSSPADTR